jgi:hypothetical protein
VLVMLLATDAAAITCVRPLWITVSRGRQVYGSVAIVMGNKPLPATSLFLLPCLPAKVQNLDTVVAAHR